MSFVFSSHALEQMQQRGIKQEDVEVAMLQPGQILIDTDNPVITIYQSFLNENGQLFLLRVFINKIKQPNGL
jgi:hypothetical protein